MMGFIPLSPLTVRCLDSGYVGKQPVAWNEYCAEDWLKELQKSMDRCTGDCDITEILMKTIISINCHHLLNSGLCIKGLK